ncbi:Na+/H+ antiporter subunit G [Marinobacter sp.]|jgi:multicomponent K+:H+ antiporter subunit G|uniref:Na+/H+ antiporter subunit G n=1 Tax=Marinobacter sp. TaxID=50741 RepID=UPI0019A502E3|nr:Na+/H+ antiporter subunit G [Marinobacter sp.]MBC7191399.1 Na+/H+ antiporter subunit G [Marinobacter sp.]
MNQALEILLSILLLTGGFFTLAGAIGLARLPDFYTRLHGPTKATTLGVGAIMISSLIYFSVTEGSINMTEILIMVFLVLTAPVSANMMAKAAMHIGVRTTEETRGQGWDQ